MKRTFKGFVLGFVVACLMITPLIAFADSIQVTLNSVNINLNGTQVAAKGQSYTLDDGTAIPYSLNYNGTTYLPVRKVSELVGKEVDYDGKSSTISISDKKAEAEEPAPNVDTEEATKPDADEEEDVLSNNNSDSDNNAKEESGFVVVNKFPKTLNSNGVQVNKVEGFLDGINFSMLTSKKDLINFSNSAPKLYEIEYSNKVITKMDLVSLDKEDMLKANAQADKLEGNKDTYNLSSIAVVYRIERDDDGNFDGYSLSKESSLRAGDKIYLYDIGGKSGYDIVIEEDSWI